jgi:hypothetical protein
MHLELHDDEAVARIHAVHAGVEGSDGKRVEGTPPGLHHGGRRGAPGRGSPVRRVHAKVLGRRALEHGVGHLAVDEHQRPLAARPDVLEEGLHHRGTPQVPLVDGGGDLMDVLRGHEGSLMAGGGDGRLHHGLRPAALGEKHGQTHGGRLVDHQGGHHAYPTLLEVQQIALAEIPADEIGMIPEAHALGLPAGEPVEEGLRLMVIVPARAEDHRVEAVEALRGSVPGKAGDRDLASLERARDVKIALGDIRPGETRDETDAAGHPADTTTGQRRAGLGYEARQRGARMNERGPADRREAARA